MDPKVNGQLQHEWGWLIAIYLFLGGVGAGAYTIAAINSFLGKSLEFSTIVGLWIGFPALLIGTLFLILDLGSPTKAVLAGMKPGTSWIARGTWIIALFMVFSFIHLVLHRFTDTPDATMNLVAALGIIFAIGTMAYTGILLSASKGIPFWRTGVVPVVFVISAVVTGHFTVILGMILFGDGETIREALAGVMAKEAAILVMLEILAIFFFLHAAFRTPDSRESAERILRKTSFVVGYFVVGLALPLALSLLLLYGMAGAGAPAVKCLAANAALFGLIGGLLLRQGVLVCGTMPTLNIGGFQFRRIARPKDPKAGMGTLPPQ